MLANRIKLLRQSRGMKQSQLAEKLGVTKQTVSNWENDNIVPSVDMLVKMADYFQVATDYLLGRDMPVDSGTRYMDIIGLNETQREHIQLLVNDLRKG